MTHLNNLQNQIKKIKKIKTISQKRIKLIICILIFIILLTIYFLTSPGKTPYDYFIRLANSVLTGRVWLTENPPWLNELIPLDGGKFTFANPPMPAILSIPFVAILKNKFQQQYLAHLIGAFIGVISYLIAFKITKSKKTSIWSAFLIGLGSIIWYLSSVGSVWYLGEITATLFTLTAIYTILNKNYLFTGIFLGLSFLSRIQIILSIPFFIFFHKKTSLKKLSEFFIGLTPFILVYGIYNLIRFGSFFQTGYTLIPGVLKESWYSKGIFSLTYIPRHLKIVFTSLPIITNKFPYIIPSWNGTAIWLTTPAFIYSLKAPIKERAVKLSWITILLLSIITFSHGTTGFTQFGYRFAVIFYPFLLFLIIKALPKSQLKWHHILLLAISILVNLWGVLWINKFGWVRF